MFCYITYYSCIAYKFCSVLLLEFEFLENTAVQALTVARIQPGDMSSGEMLSAYQL